MESIYEYTDYKKYLNDAFTSMKANKKTFSHRMFARLAGFSSSNFMLFVMQGKRNLSSEGIHKVAKGLKLSKKETDFFDNLVRFNQAKSNSEKNFYYSKIMSHKKCSKAKKLEMGQYEYYSKWYIPVIREMITMKGFKPNSKWISKKIKPRISEAEVKRAIKILFELGLIKRDEDGKLVQQERHISSGDEVKSLAVANFQHEMINLAAKSIEETPAKMREISSVTFTISKDDLPEVKKMIQEFRSRFAGTIAEIKDGDNVYQFNMQLFNLTET